MNEPFVKSKLGCRCELKNGEVTSQRLKMSRAQWNYRSLSVNVLSIVDASREQSAGIKEINQAVSQMDQGTQKNAATVEESTAASHSLAREAEALFVLVGKFETDGHSTSQHQSDERPSPARQLMYRVTSSFPNLAA